MSIRTSLSSVIAGFERSNALRDRLNELNELIEKKQRHIAKTSELGNRPNAVLKVSLANLHTQLTHELNRLLDEKFKVREAWLAASGHASGMANATARRIAK